MNVGTIRRLWSALSKVNWKSVAPRLSSTAAAAISGYFAGVGGRARESNEDFAEYLAQQVAAIQTPQEMAGFVATLASSADPKILADVRAVLDQNPAASADVGAMFDDLVAKHARYRATGDGKASAVSLDVVTRVRRATTQLKRAAASLGISLDQLYQLRSALSMDEDLVDAVMQNEEAILAEKIR